MKIEIITDRDYNSLFTAMETVLEEETKYAVALGWVTKEEAQHESCIRKAMSTNPFLNAGRDSLIEYLDTGFSKNWVIDNLTADQVKWLDEQQERIASVFCIVQGKDY